MVITNELRASVLELYTAYFNRAADTAGVDYWLNEMVSKDWSMLDVAASFADQAEFSDVYGGLNNSQIVTTVYNNVLGRSPEQSGHDYWVEQLESGAISVENLITAVLNSATEVVNGEPVNATDKDMVDNKTAASQYLYDNNNSQTDILLDSITDDDDTLVDFITNLEDNGIDGSINNVYTLTENAITTVTPAVDGEVITQMATYWGDGVENGVPVADLLAYIAGLANANNGVNPLLAKLEDIGVITASQTELNQDNFDFTTVTNLTVGDNGTMSFTYENDAGEIAQAEVDLGALYEGLVRDLIFDENGNSRLFEVEVAAKTLWIDATGTSGYPTAAIAVGGTTYQNVVVDAQGNPIEITAMTNATAAVTTTVTTPIILTTDVNNGGTEEVGYTSADDDTIVAGRLDLLHGAYIDGGAGENTLEVDAKGYFAQPKELVNIQTINVENLANVYTDANGTNNYPNIQDAAAVTDSILDLSRADELESLTITEGSYGNTLDDNLGTLTVSGVRADATLTLEGQFTQNVTVSYSQGLTDGTNIVLNLGDTNGATFDILTNSATVNIDSIGGGNAIDATFTASSLTNMNISGDAKLQIANSLTPNFQAGTPATIDASANTAGVDLTINDFNDEVVFTGTSADDHFNANTNGKSVLVNSSTGDDEISANNGQIVTINASEGNNEISATNAAVSATVDATDGNNIVDVSGSTAATVTLGNGNNNVTADTVTDLNVTAGNGNNTIESINSTNANITTADGSDTITVSAADITVNSGMGDDTVSVAGTLGGGVAAAGGAINLMLILNNSGSLSAQQLADTKAATIALLDQYQAAGTNVMVNVMSFSPDITGTNDWVSIADAKAEINLLDATGGTNFDTALTDAITEWATAGKIAGATNQIAFTSDGQSTIQASTVTTWETFLNDNNITANAFGMGAGTSTVALDPVAFDGVSNTQLNAIVVDDSSDLTDAMSTAVTGAMTGNDAVINIDLGEGYNTLVLGDSDELTQGLTALEGSTITGENITLVVNQDSNLIAIEDLSSITSVILDNNEASSTVDTTNAVLTLTAAQFVEIGAANFSVEGSVFNTYSQIEIIVTEDTSLTDLGADVLANNIDLKLIVNDGVNLEMTAQQLHENVAANGVTLVTDNNTDIANGTVTITGAGEDFDPFNTSDTVQTNIAGTEYFGGSLSSDFLVNGAWYNIDLGAVYKGYDRPTDVAVEQVFTIDADLLASGETVETIETWHTNLEIIGTQDLAFDGLLQIGQNLGDAKNTFNIDFSSLEGTASNMTIDHFEMLGQGGSIVGNANSGYDSVVNVHINADDDTDGVGFDEADAQSLVSTGVTKYVVTSIDGTPYTADTATIKLCDTTIGLETIALQGNYEDTLVVENAAWGLGFELQGGSTLKVDGPTGTSNVGAIEANYMWSEANANVDIIHANPADTRPLFAAGIEIVNASTITVNAESDTTITAISDGAAETTLTSLVLNANGDLTITDAIETEVTSIDASGTTGDLTISSDITSTEASDFTFVGSAGTTELTLTSAYIASEDTSFTSAGTLDVIVSDGDAATSISTDLTAADVSGISTILVGAGDTLNLTIAQANTIDPANITGEDGTTSILVLSDLAEEKFVKADYDLVNLNFTTLEVIAADTVTLHADTDLTGIETLTINDGTTLNLTAAQFVQLTDEGTITSVTGGTSDFTINITDLTQADLDAGFDLSGIDIDATVILNLAESIDMPNNTTTTTYSVDNADVINMGDDMMLTINTFEEVDGVEINGGVNSTVKFTDSIVDGDSTTSGIQYPSIDASGFDITNILFLNLVSGDINVDEQLFVNLPSDVTKVVYNGEGMATALSQTVTIQEQSSIDGTYTAFNKSGDDQETVEITDFTINLEGGVNIAGDIELSTDNKENGFTGNELLKQGLQTVTINSTGTAENFFTGETVNVMGTLTPRGTNVASSTDNTLTNVVINAEQALEMEGIEFNSWSESNSGESDGWTINDDDAATATVTINGTADVALGLLDSSDDEVDAMVVNNVGTGTVTATINAANIDDNGTDNVDALSFTGSNIELTIIGTVDLSDDDLSGVSLLTFDDASVVTMSQAQVDALGAANIVVDDSEAATLNIVEFGSTPFDATTFDEQLDIHTITMTAGTNTLNGDFTDVNEIVVPEGGVLNLTAAQFQQLLNDGTITALDTDGDTANDSITVNITDLTQADIDAGSFVTTDIAAGNTVTLSLAEDIILSTDDVIETIDTVIMADGQTLSVVTQAQADGLVTDAGINTAINLEYDVNASTNAPIDASGYDVSKVDVWSTGVNDSDVEWEINNLPNDVVLHIVESALQISDVADVNRQVVIEEGVAVPGFLVFNGDDNDRELETLEITFSGDASDRTEEEDFDHNLEGSIITGDLELDFDPSSTGTDISNDYFTKLTLNSTGTGTSNGITGNITPIDTNFEAEANDNISNNLLDVEINADANFTIGGSIEFNSVNLDASTIANETATLTINGAADVSVQHLIVNNDISTLAVANDGTGTLTVTGASPAIDGVLENLTFSGTGDIVLDTVATSQGVDGNSVLSTIDASALSGDLTLGDVEDLDVADFAFTAGTGVTTVNFEGVTLNADVDGDTPTTLDDGTGFAIDVSNAAAGTEVHLGANTYTDGALNINLGANGTLFIDANTDFTDLDILNISQVNAIVLADEVTLTLTAEQANTLNIIGVDTDNDGIFGTVTVVDLGTVAVDLSGISADIAGTTYLDATNDVTLDAATNLGDFSVTLIDSDATAEGMLGQTIRFQDETQAAREVIVEATTANLADTGAGVDTNVVWLFDTITDSVNTGNSDITPVYDYDLNLGRLWVTEDLLANNNNVEDLFTTLPSTIVRVEFTDLNELNYALGSNGIARTVEMVAFTDLSATGLTFSDSDRFEDIDTLTLNLGGQVQTGDIVLDNIIAPSADPLELDPNGIEFTGLTINSYLVDDQDHFLAPELFVNNGDGTDEAGEHELPNEINTIGNISVGANNGVDLLKVTLDTIETNLTVGTITFDAESIDDPNTVVIEKETATLNVSGAYTTTVASLNTTDADIATLAVVNTGSGALVVTGASPAAAVSDTETLTIEVQSTGSVTLGTAGDATKPGISSAELSLVSVTGAASGAADVNLGLIANVDGVAQVDTNSNPITSFELNTTAHDGTVSAVFGDASAAPVLADDAIWEFTNGTTGTLNLTFTDDVVLGAGDVTFTNVTMTIDGAVDFTTLNELTLSGTTIDVPAGSSLTILAEDADALTVTGDGIVNIVDAEAVLTADYSNVMTTDGDTGTVNVLFDTSDGDDADLLPDDLVFTGNLGKAITTVIGDGSLDVTSATLDTAAFDHDDDALTPDEVVMSSFIVDAAATLELAPNQLDDRTVSGAGTVEFLLNGAPNDVNLANMTAATINGRVTANENFNEDADFGTANIEVMDTITLTVIGETVDGLAVTGEGRILVNSADLDGDSVEDAINADFSNFTVETIRFVPTALVDTIVFPALYGDPLAVPAVAVQTVSLSSVQADGQTIVGATPSVTGSVIVTVDDTVDADLDGDVDAFDLSNIDAGTMTATINDTTDDTVVFDSAVNFGSFDIVITAGDSVTMSAAQADGLNISETGVATIIVTDLEDTPNADLSNIVVDSETALLDANGGVTLGANLGTNMLVTVSDSVVGADTVTFTGTMNSAGTTFDLVTDDITLVLDAADANLLTVTDNAGANVVEDTDINFTGALTAGSISVDVGGVTVLANFNATEDQTLTDLTAAINAEFVNQGSLATATFAGAGSDQITITGDTNGNPAPAITNVDVSLAVGYSATPAVVITNTIANNTDVSVVVNNLGSDEVDFTNIVADTLTANVPVDATLHVNSNLANFDVVLAEGVTLGLTTTQLLAVDEPDFSGTPAGDEFLAVSQYNGEDIQSDELGSDITISTLTVKDTNALVSVNSLSDFTDVQEIVIPDGTSLTMTADQFMQLPTGTVSGLGTLNLVDFDNDNALIDLSNVTANHGTITLDSTATTVVLDPSANLGTASIVMTANNQSITFSSETQADARDVDGVSFTGTVVVLGFTSADATDADANIESSGFDVENVWVINEYIQNEFGGSVNMEDMLTDLRDTATSGNNLVVTVYDAETILSSGTGSSAAITTTARYVVIDEETTLTSDVAFDDLNTDGAPGTLDVAVGTLDLTLSGNSQIVGDLTLPQQVDPQANVDAGTLIPVNAPTYLTKLTINSNDSVATGAAGNVINGNIFADDGTDGAGSESHVETFTLTLDALTSIVGAEEKMEFDGDIISFSNGDNAAALATAIAGGSYNNYTAVALGNTVTFTNKNIGDVTDITLGDFTFTSNNASTVLGTPGVTTTAQGLFTASENNLYEVKINADHALDITGELEMSYVTRSVSNAETVTATILVNGNSAVNIGSVNTDDEHITGVTLTTTGLSSVTAPGTSPGAALGNTETLTIDVQNAASSVTLGTASDDSKPGVAGDELSEINILGAGTVNLGVISSIDSDLFALDITGGTPTLTFTLGSDTFGPNTPTLNAGGKWTFDLIGTTSNTMTIADATFGAGTLNIYTGTAATDALVIDGIIDMSAANTEGLSNGGDTEGIITPQITINTAADLTMTSAQAADTDIGSFEGTGELSLTGLATATDIITIAGKLNQDLGSTVNFDGSAITQLTGTAVDILTAYAALNVTPTAFDVVLLDDVANQATDIIAVAALAGIGQIDGSALEEIDGTASDILTALADIDVDPANFNSLLVPEAAYTTYTGITADITAGDTIDFGPVTGNEYTATIGTTVGATASVAEVQAAIEAQVPNTVTATFNGTDLVLTINDANLPIVGGDFTDVDNASAITTPTDTLANEDAADIVAIFNVNGTGDIDANAVLELSGTSADITTLFTNEGATTVVDDLTAKVDLNPTVVVNASDPMTVAQANVITPLTSGVLTATISDQDMATLVTLVNDGVDANALTITVADTTINAVDANTINDRTSVAVDATAATVINGAAADVNAMFNVIPAEITIGVAPAVNVTSGALTVAQANVITPLTDGILTADIDTTETLATLVTLTADTTPTQNALTIVIAAADATANADSLNIVDARTSVNVDAATNVTGLVGTGTGIATAISATTIDTAATVTATVDSGTLDVADQITIDANTTGLITGTITEGDMLTLATLTDANTTGLNALTVTVTDTTAVASELLAIDDKTLVTVTATALTSITGTGSDIATAVTAAGINDSGTEAITVDSGTLSVADQITIDANTTGLITGTITEGDMATLATLTDLNGTGLNALTVTVTDTTAVASELLEIDAKTSVTVTATALTSITGTSADIVAVITAIGASTITANTNIALTATAIPTATVAEAETMVAYTSGVVTAAVTADTAANLNATLNSGTNADLLTLTLQSGDTASASDVIALNAQTGVAVNANAAISITGTSSQAHTVATAIDAGEITIGATTVVANGTAAQDTMDFSSISTVGMTINGLGDGDTITGGQANDIIDGGAGNDNITGGLGADTMTGGLGNDTFVMTDGLGATDIITDWGYGGGDFITGALGAGDTLNVQVSDFVGVANVDPITSDATYTASTADTLNKMSDVTDDGTATITLTTPVAGETIFIDLNASGLATGYSGSLATVTSGAEIAYTFTGTNDVTDLASAIITAGYNVSIAGNAITVSSNTATFTSPIHTFVDDGQNTSTAPVITDGDVTFAAAGYDVGDEITLSVTGSAGQYDYTHTVLAGATSANDVASAFELLLESVNPPAGGDADLNFEGGIANVSSVSGNVLTIDNDNGGDGSFTLAASVVYAGGYTFDASSIAATDGSVDVVGGNGADTLIGGVNDDTLEGGTGTDTLTGGLGADTFVFATGDADTTGNETITDFQSGVDILDFSVAATSGLNYSEADGSGTANLAAFITNANTYFNGVSGNASGVSYYAEYNINGSGDGFLAYDDNAGSIIDEVITLTGVSTAADIADTDIV